MSNKLDSSFHIMSNKLVNHSQESMADEFHVHSYVSPCLNLKPASHSASGMNRWFLRKDPKWSLVHIGKRRALGAQKGYKQGSGCGQHDTSGSSTYQHSEVPTLQMLRLSKMVRHLITIHNYQRAMGRPLFDLQMSVNIPTAGYLINTFLGWTTKR